LHPAAVIANPGILSRTLNRRAAGLLPILIAVMSTFITPAVKAAEDTPYPDAKRGNIKAAIWLSDHLHKEPVQLFVAG
jgi:hypothetical protein